MTYRIPGAVRIDDRTAIIPADVDAWRNQYGRDPLAEQDARACPAERVPRACPARACADEHDPRACPDDNVA